MRTPDGRKYKLLVAPLILELDSRLNLNAVGNLMGTDASKLPTHRSHQGWGVWEINDKIVSTLLDPFTNHSVIGPASKKLATGRKCVVCRINTTNLRLLAFQIPDLIATLRVSLRFHRNRLTEIRPSLGPQAVGAESCVELQP